MKILIIVLAVLVLAVVGLLVIASTRPTDFRVERAIRVSANPAAVFAQLNDFHAWQAWSPWAKLDPSMQTQYEGPASGVGAKYSWLGNSKVGQGSMSLVESIPDAKIGIQLEFLKPIKASNRTTFTLQPGPSETTIVWTMEGKNQLLSKVMGLFMDMDKLIGADFERGLASLKAVAEHGSAAP